MIVSFIIIFGTLSFSVETACNKTGVERGPQGGRIEPYRLHIGLRAASGCHTSC